MSNLFERDGLPPALKGQTCLHCGRISFPPNAYGCEKCGATADKLADRTLAGRGRIRAFVTTHHANQRELVVPYTIASIALDDGPVIRAMMTDATGVTLAAGDIVESSLEDGGDVLHFRKREAA